MVSWSAMRRSGAGVPSSGRPTPISCAVGAPAPATNGTSTRSSSKINGKIHYLWRAVDQHGNVLDVLVQPRRDAKAAKKFFRRPAQGPAVRAARAGHRQAGQLPGRPPRAHVVGGAPAVAVSEPRRELSSAHPATRTGDETLQNRRGMRNGSCPPSAASPHTSGRDGICSARPNGEPRWPTASRSGVRSPRSTLPPEM